jgi:hypothetical protein
MGWGTVREGKAFVRRPGQPSKNFDPFGYPKIDGGLREPWEGTQTSGDVEVGVGGVGE